MSDPLLQYADVASGLAEIEAAELRLELCAYFGRLFFESTLLIGEFFPL
jgi:hypothetical protein